MNQDRINELYDQLGGSHACDEWAESDAFAIWMEESIEALKRGEDVKWSVRQGISRNRSCGVTCQEVLEAVTNHPDWLGAEGDRETDTISGHLALSLVQHRTGMIEVLREEVVKLFELEALKLLDREADWWPEYLKQHDAERAAEDKADRQRYDGAA